MKNFSIQLGLICAFLSCSPEKSELSDIGQLTLPDSFSYKGKKPSLADSSLLEPVIEWNEKLSNLDTDLGHLFADSITWHWSHGENYTYSKDSLLSMIQSSLAETKRISITIAAALPVHYSDTGDSWVYSWIYEEVEDKDGIRRSHYLHEDFRIVEGRIREIYQFKRDKN